MIIALLVGYISFIILLGKHKTATNVTAFQSGNHQLGFWTILIMVTALWSSSLIVVEIDAAYQYGMSALWYGVSVALMSVLVSLLMPWFHQHAYISNSDLLGRTFGREVRRLSGMVIGGTFPIFALSNALAAAVFLQTALSWPLWLSLSVTTLLLIVTIQFAGMLSLAQMQGFNLLMVMIGLVYALHTMAPPLSHPKTVMPPKYWHLWGVGHGIVAVWFGMNILNVVCAQAEIQTLAAARHIRHAKWATWLSTLWLLVIIAVSTWLGVMTRLLTPNPHMDGMDGLEAFFHIVLAHSSPLWVALFGMSMWSLAIMWCGPLLFSGAISVTHDVMGQFHSLTWLRIGLIVEGVIMILYGLWRPGELAWWRVFGLTLRNAAVVGPTLVVLLWKDTFPRKAVLLAIASGIGTGLGLNAITGFSATHFVWGINPMWSAATITMVILATARLLHQRQLLGAILGVALWGLLTVLLIRDGSAANLLGILLLFSGLLFMGYAWILTRSPDAELKLYPLSKSVESD
ncbi:hypothetical protein [Sulfobacillus thermosulfidooxidans]|uniref:hypothetical protein n=1 Tax=Sulfobacillus thermosulfidooxidans TaxID=28034 RepID=UPI0004191F42|nr:hypothetical protein [Sulfobacillus thermosulfidooxidans]